MPFAFITIMMILVEIHSVFKYKEILTLGNITEEERTVWVKENWKYVAMSYAYLGYCFYLVFTPFWMIGTIQFIQCYVVSSLRKYAPSINWAVKIVDFAISMTLLSWILYQVV